MYLRETGCEDMVWIHLDQHRVQWRILVSMVMSLRYTKKFGIIKQIECYRLKKIYFL
jgi:hypothetical protein